MKIEIGKDYKVIHSRKGTFEMRVTREDEEFVTGDIIGGVANSLCACNVAVIGDEVIVRRSFCTLVPLDKP